MLTFDIFQKNASFLKVSEIFTRTRILLPET